MHNVPAFKFEEQTRTDGRTDRKARKTQINSHNRRRVVRTSTSAQLHSTALAARSLGPAQPHFCQPTTRHTNQSSAHYVKSFEK